MPHRSNQAVASQDQAAPQPPSDPPPRRRLLIGWTTALAALAVSTAVLAGGVWLVRLSIGEFLIGAALAERGLVADFQVTELELNHASIRALRIGAAAAPDASVTAIDAEWRWRGIVPELVAVRVREPRLRLVIDTNGRVSAGTLDQMRAQPSARRASVPAMRLTIEDGQAEIAAPFGALSAQFHSDGVLGRDFSGRASIAPTSQANGDYAIENAGADIVVVSRQNALAFRLSGHVQALRWRDQHLTGAGVRLIGRAPLDLSRYDAEGSLRIASIAAPRMSLHALDTAFGIAAIARDDALIPNQWRTRGRLRADQMTLASNRFDHLRIDAHGDGRDNLGSGGWTLAAQSFSGLALSSAQPSASGAFRLRFNGATHVDADARIVLAGSRLDNEAQQRIRNVFPDLPEAPIGPTFAQAENALDRAADRFDLTIPLLFRSDDERAHFSIAAPIEARAASGAVLRIAPLRQDASALDVQWPELTLRGMMAVELQGGGAPTTSLLLDRVAWTPDAAFEAEGTLAVSRWHAQNARIAADELSLALSIAPNGDGRADIRGPARITGPLGAGEVRDLVADLDLLVAWDQGWRVTSNRGCLPIRIGGLDAAGLSFANGSLALCPRDGALIAANAQDQLSGGFLIESLSLGGRLAGPDAQPAQLSTRHIAARFSGTTDHARLALQADAPTLSVQMAEERTLSVIMQRITAEAHIADSWRVDGVFERGGLTDPSLPGSVSAIAGRWSAAPENDEAVIRVAAAEALLIANRPASDEQRPLFNPVRLRDVNALLRGGRIDAEGAIVLEQNAHSLASFTAEHDTQSGAGAAHIDAANLVFDQNLQPHDISERARGLVANVRGPAAAMADIAWNGDTMTSRGRLGLQGVSLATATLPVIQNVRGDIMFDDLFALTTPPGQQLSVGLVNPGVSVRDGRVRFQLLPEQRISIEQAEFAFASGMLAMSPTTIQLGEDETRIELTLRNVDASRLIAELELPDIAATGELEGSFPLLLTRRSAFVQNGMLRAAPGGGMISYTGQAGENATGMSRIAFDALRSFRYDQLSLTLDGDLSGDVVSSINFTGVNAGQSVDLGPIAPVPGVGNVQVSNVPFVFNVNVIAPFRRLAETAATIVDPGSILDRAGTGQTPADEPVDQTRPGS